MIYEFIFVIPIFFIYTTNTICIIFTVWTQRSSSKWMKLMKYHED